MYGNGKMYVFATTQAEVYHRWPEAPPQSSFQSVMHRHILRIRVAREVSRDHEIDTIELKHSLELTVVRLLQMPAPGGQQGQFAFHTWSSEEWCHRLAKALDLDECEIAEDGELGAVYRRGPRVAVAMSSEEVAKAVNGRKGKG